MAKVKKPLTTRGRIQAEARDIVVATKTMLEDNKLEPGKYTLNVGTSVVLSKCSVTVHLNDGRLVGESLVDISMVDLFADSGNNWDIAEKVIKSELGFKNCVKLPNIRTYKFTF